MLSRQNFQNGLKNKINRARDLSRKQIAEWSRATTYCKKARDGLDDLLATHLPNTGTYIEAGALDGFEFSNTYYLDRVRGWKGLLVEPNPMQFTECQRFRTRADVVHCALVPFDYQARFVNITYGHDLTWTEGAYDGEELAHRKMMLERNSLSGEQISVPAKTIQSLIEAYSLEVTLLSLDVEGYELQVLRGLDFAKSAPLFLLVECQNDTRHDAIKRLLGSRYAAGIKLTRHDYLFRRL